MVPVHMSDVHPSDIQTTEVQKLNIQTSDGTNVGQYKCQTSTNIGILFNSLFFSLLPNYITLKIIFKNLTDLRLL